MARAVREKTNSVVEIDARGILSRELNVRLREVLAAMYEALH